METPQLALKLLFLQDLSNPNSPSSGLVTVTRANSLARGTDLPSTEFRLLKSINNGVQIEADVRAVRDENPLAGVLETLLLQRGEFLEETGDVDDSSGADEVNAAWRDEA